MKTFLNHVLRIQFKNVLAFTITLVWLYTHMYCVLHACNVNNELITNFNIIEAMIVGYYFGSSYNSTKKDELLEDANQQIGLNKCKEEYE